MCAAVLMFFGKGALGRVYSLGVWSINLGYIPEYVLSGYPFSTLPCDPFLTVPSPRPDPILTVSSRADSFLALSWPYTNPITDLVLERVLR